MEREYDIKNREHLRLSLIEGKKKKVLTRAPSLTVSVSPPLASGFPISSPSMSATTSTFETGAKFQRRTQTTLNGNTYPRRTTPSPAPIHPFAYTTAKLEILPSSSNADGIDIEEEARLYDDLCGNYEGDTDTFIQSNIPVNPPSSASKLVKPKPKPPPTVSSLSRTQYPRPRSLPPESIFSADIFLADNTGSASNGIAPLFAQDVHIAGWSTVGDGGGKFGLGSTKTVSMGGGGAYVVYDCVITTREGTAMHVLKRYSAFEELREALKRSLPASLLPSIPALPPKSALGRFRPAFLDFRRKLLQFFLVSVLLHPEIGGREVVRRWVLS